MTLGHLVLAIIAGLIIGALVGYQLGRYSMRGDGASIGNEAPRTDAFGRPPGDPHYGHNHP